MGRGLPYRKNPSPAAEGRISLRLLLCWDRLEEQVVEPEHVRETSGGVCAGDFHRQLMFAGVELELGQHEFLGVGHLGAEQVDLAVFKHLAVQPQPHHGIVGGAAEDRLISGSSPVAGKSSCTT